MVSVCSCLPLVNYLVECVCVRVFSLVCVGRYLCICTIWGLVNVYFRIARSTLSMYTTYEGAPGSGYSRSQNIFLKEKKKKNSNLL